MSMDVPYPLWAMPTKVIKESELLTKATDFICVVKLVVIEVCI